ncbi:unnamed protein product [Peronospora farinosa]|uniref:Uncharacterized protein n=1 Tax=Peronospora farinosa TaxID=134698 RepID=A0AAV0STM6_9STRA|nr:unnamed protein product [Peronospora farinosa]CAI5705899.1 unnamed protein product [Peronospora farinosa]
MSSSDLNFQDDAWLLVEPKRTFCSPRYRQERFLVRCQALTFWSQPQTVLQLGQIEYLVLNCDAADACKRSGDLKETKKLLQLSVRPLDDVRRTQLYHTSAHAQVLEVFVDGEGTRELLLRCLRGEKNEKKLLDDAFESLVRAQQSRDKETAIGLYKEAERGFGEAEKVVDARSRELLRERRGDLQRTIRELEEEVQEGIRNAVAGVVPKKVTLISQTIDISARLEELRRFAAKQDDANALQGNRANLTGRLAALKNEKAQSAMPVDVLTERLRRLRGYIGPDEGAPVVGSSGVERMSAVDRVIQQVVDEIAFDIEDEDFDVDETVEESDSSSYGSSHVSKSSKF